LIALMAAFEVLGPVPDAVDGAIAAAAATIWRQGGRIHIAMTSAPAPFLRDAAFAGLRLRLASVAAAERPLASIEAHGRDLRPIQCDEETVDRLEVRPIQLAEATRHLLRRPFPFAPLSARRNERCRDLLHERDIAYLATRVVWCPRSALRDPSYRRILRPVVFDRDAGAPVLARTARDGDLAAWLRG